MAAQLRAKGYDFCLPLFALRRQWSDRVKILETPLFPGYVFCRFNPDHRLPLLTTPGVSSVVGFGNGPVAVDEVEMSAIHSLCASGLQMQPWPFLSVGKRVRINYGAMRGVEGILLELRGNYRVVLSVTLLQRSVSVEVDAAWVAATGEQRKESVSTGWIAKPATA